MQNNHKFNTKFMKTEDWAYRFVTCCIACQNYKKQVLSLKKIGYTQETLRLLISFEASSTSLRCRLSPSSMRRRSKWISSRDFDRWSWMSGTVNDPLSAASLLGRRSFRPFPLQSVCRSSKNTSSSKLVDRLVFNFRERNVLDLCAWGTAYGFLWQRRVGLWVLTTRCSLTRKDGYGLDALVLFSASTTPFCTLLLLLDLVTGRPWLAKTEPTHVTNWVFILTMWKLGCIDDVALFILFSFCDTRSFKYSFRLSVTILSMPSSLSAESKSILH